MNIEKNYKTIVAMINSACEKVHRDPSEVKLMAVSKFHCKDEIEEAIRAGATLFGENRVQETLEKFPAIKECHESIELHLIGQLQSNKVSKIVPHVDCIQSVDRLKILREIEKQATLVQKKIRVFLEIHTGEESKSGFCSQKEIEEALRESLSMDFVKIGGFMTMAPFTSDNNAIRASFAKARTIAENMKKMFPTMNLDELSMGMSNDFMIAIEEGSTLVRVGTALFGKRR